MKNGALKEKAIHELKLFLIYTLFFAFFFCLFGTYKRLILGEYAISYVRYGYNLFEAMILSKIILLGQTLKLGEGLKNKPLIYPALYKTILFTLFAFIFAILEHFVIGFLKGEKTYEVYHHLMETGLDRNLSELLVISFVFFLFFSLLELTNYFGTKKIFDLFFRNVA